MSLVETYGVYAYGKEHEVKRHCLAPNLMIGGMVLNLDDGAHLDDLGITAQIGLDTTLATRLNDLAHPSAEAVGPNAALLLSAPDDGKPKPVHWFHAGISFAFEHLDKGGKLYVHDELGGRRAQAMCYAILRTYHRMEAHQAFQRMWEDIPAFGGDPESVMYLMSAELAIAAY